MIDTTDDITGIALGAKFALALLAKALEREEEDGTDLPLDYDVAEGMRALIAEVSKAMLVICQRESTRETGRIVEALGADDAMQVARDILTWGDPEGTDVARNTKYVAMIAEGYRRGVRAGRQVEPEEEAPAVK